jgi:hypothetical protein
MSCVSCFKGDTDTVFAVEGVAEWCIASLMRFADLDQETATATFEVFCVTNLGCDPGTVPAGRIEVGFRLCPDCAERTGARLSVPGEHGIVYTQPG